MQIYLVGGAVRDKYLNRPVKDRDWVVVGATVEKMLDAGYKPVGKDFPVFLHPKTHEEYALARTERKIAAGYTGFQFYATPDVSLEQDLQRRDLTINAMAEDAEGQLIDPYHGLADLRAGILRHVSPAFAEDPVRILRIARFAARYNFEIAPETLALMQHMVTQGEVNALVAERVWQELAKGLMESRPRIMLEVLRACGALRVLLPQLDALFGVPQPTKHHPEIDSGEHTLLTLQYAAQQDYTLAERFASLMHDLGKARTPPEDWPHHYGHDVGGLKPLAEIRQKLRIPKDCAELAALACTYHTRIHSVSQLRSRTILKLLHQTDAFRRPERFLSLLKICLADSRGRLGLENSPYPQQDYWLKLLDAASNIDAAAIARQQTEPTRIADAIDRARLLNIKAIHRSSGR
ncbi:multifunctional CCA addition/repair protein [Neisseriaceae bacterium ESL0693]|nr:multifunctional CCA addition/repair protein [Neisseriaceae bacterium ESL0693]